ncbi:hypothetical protein DSM112329_02212 [Paraconexibacter sp. AEG42_29]|uniref:DUF222 domain-containing protein n=1 Tax=Paraconexibacter sp. AEG42_29 TaxID=2997339 RepID=A0AAU7AUR5_9ACTN
MDAGATAPWEKCARRAVPLVIDDLLHLARTAGRTPLAGAQHLAARRRAETIAPYVDAAPVMKDLAIAARPVGDGEWSAALVAAVGSRSREAVARAIAQELDVAVAGTQEPLFAAGDPAS